MRIFNKIIQGNKEPQNKNDLWVKPDGVIYKYDEGWQKLVRADSPITYPAIVYKESTIMPERPVGGDYDFEKNIFTPPEGWTNAPINTGNPVWQSVKIFYSQAYPHIEVVESEWSTPFKITGARGPVIYPQGKYDVNKEYINDGLKAPYVLDTLNDQYYLLDKVGVWVGTDHSNLHPSQDNDGYWVKFEQFELIHTNIGIINNGLIGSAVFNSEYMFSQQGQDRYGNYSDSYEQFNPANPYATTNTFRPNICFNLATGEVWLNCGKTHFDVDGSGSIASNAIKWDKDGNVILSDDVTIKWEAVEGGQEVIDNLQSKLLNTEKTLNDKIEESKTESNKAIEEALASYDEELLNLQKSLDGVVENFFEEGVPTTTNYPAASWSDTEKINHIGDTYTNILSYEEDIDNAGKSWRWCYCDDLTGITDYITVTVNGVTKNLHWHPIADSDAVKALLEAQKAAAAVDGKCSMFLTQPSNYSVGDLWILQSDNDHTAGKKGDILTANTSSVVYNASHWEKMVYYTDDTKALEAIQTANNAKADAEAAKTIANNNDEKLNEWASDSKLSPIEQKELLNKKEEIIADYTQIKADITTYTNNGIVIDGTDAFTTAYNNAISAIDEHTVGIATGEAIDIKTSYANIAAYYTARQVILTEIANKTLADSEAKSEELFNDSLTSLEATMKKYSDDTAKASLDTANTNINTAKVSLSNDLTTAQQNLQAAIDNEKAARESGDADAIKEAQDALAAANAAAQQATNTAGALTALETAHNNLQAEVDKKASQSDLDATNEDLTNTKSTILTEGDVTNLSIAAITEQTKVTGDSVSTQTVIAQNLIALAGLFAEVKAENIVGTTIKGLNIQSATEGTLLDGTTGPLWKLNQDGSGYLAGQKVILNTDGTIKISNFTIDRNSIYYVDEENDIQWVLSTTLGLCFGTYNNIYKNVHIDVNGNTYFAQGNAKFKNDGSGQIGNNLNPLISWDVDGNINIGNTENYLKINNDGSVISTLHEKVILYDTQDYEYTINTIGVDYMFNPQFEGSQSTNLTINIDSSNFVGENHILGNICWFSVPGYTCTLKILFNGNNHTTYTFSSTDYHEVRLILRNNSLSAILRVDIDA